MNSKLHSKLWLLFAAITTISWGAWGALIEIPEQAGFHPTLGYAIWSLTMIPPALIALWVIGWKMDFRLKPVLIGLTVGFTGAGGQLVLFHALSIGPEYLVFPIVSLAPVITVVLSLVIYAVIPHYITIVGMVSAIVAAFLLSMEEDDPDPVVIKQKETEILDS